MKSNIFSKIISKEVSANILYEDNLITAFYDIYPKAPIHIIIIPNINISSMNNIKKSHKNLLGHMLIIASKLAKKLLIHKSGYRIIINCNKNGGQEIYHLHMHLLGGCYLGPILKI